MDDTGLDDTGSDDTGLDDMGLDDMGLDDTKLDDAIQARLVLCNRAEHYLDMRRGGRLIVAATSEKRQKRAKTQKYDN